jgi:hypothetical protein
VDSSGRPGGLAAVADGRGGGREKGEGALGGGAEACLSDARDTSVSFAYSFTSKMKINLGKRDVMSEAGDASVILLYIYARACVCVCVSAHTHIHITYKFICKLSARLVFVCGCVRVECVYDLMRKIPW